MAMQSQFGTQVRERFQSKVGWFLGVAAVVLFALTIFFGSWYQIDQGERGVHLRNGAVIDANSTDPRVLGVRRFNELLAADPGISATIIQTVGTKGYDGFAFAVVV